MNDFALGSVCSFSPWLIGIFHHRCLELIGSRLEETWARYIFSYITILRVFTLTVIFALLSI